MDVRHQKGVIDVVVAQLIHAGEFGSSSDSLEAVQADVTLGNKMRQLQRIVPHCFPARPLCFCQSVRSYEEPGELQI